MLKPAHNLVCPKRLGRFSVPTRRGKRSWRQDGLIHSPTGSGKRWPPSWSVAGEIGRTRIIRRHGSHSGDLDHTLRALASDTAAALPGSGRGVGRALFGSCEPETRARQRKQNGGNASILVTTPESLTLLLTHQEVLEQFKGLRGVVCDEWHELLASKRGVQTDLALSRLRNLAPNTSRVGGFCHASNVQEAAQALVGPDRPPPELVRGTAEKTIEVECLLPEKVERLAWSGHIGVRLVPLVLERIRQATSTIIFTNTRAQAEIWYRVGSGSA